MAAEDEFSIYVEESDDYDDDRKGDYGGEHDLAVDVIVVSARNEW